MTARSARGATRGGRDPGIPCDAEGPVFREPWEAQASRWRWRCTSAACSPGRMGGDARRRDQARAGRGRPRHRRDLLPALARDAGAADRRKGVADDHTLHRYRDAWDHAADRTPHGKPIELAPQDFQRH